MAPENQTRSEWLKTAVDNIADQPGTGVFLVPAPDIGPLEFRKILVPNIGYRETAKRAVGCPAFKWIPSHLGTQEQLVTLSCESISCVSSDDCLGLACLCSGGQCY
jgi:hypothetical protein